MCYYRCLLCGHLYEVEKRETCATADGADYPDWSSADNSCPVCGGLALPCPTIYCGPAVLRARYDVMKVGDVGA
jgi:rubredoxin